VATVPTPQKIVIIEDDPNISTTVARALESEGFQVSVTFNGLAGIHRVENNSPDLVILDIMLPDISGFEVCRRVLRIKDIPVVMLTARVEETDRVRGFEVGAADYVTKPFSLRELVARVRAILRRQESSSSTPPLLRAGNVELDPSERILAISDRRIELTPTEFAIVRTLLENLGRVVTRDRLARAVWGQNISDLHILQAHISNLRRKIEDNPRQPRYLKTVRGIGYKFVV